MIDGQENSKSAAFACPAVNLDFAAVIFYDPFADRQAEAQPFSLSCAEERQEDLGQIFVVYAKAAVGDRYRYHRTCKARAFLLGFHFQTAADRHRIDGVQIEIQQ